MSGLNPLDYLPGPKFSLAGGISLAYGLFAAKPKSASEAVARYAAELKTFAELLNGRWATRERAEAERAASETRPADQHVDACARALHGRLSAAAMLPEGDDAAKAARLLGSLFPEGLSFLNSRYDEEWSHLHKLLRRIDDEELAAEIDALAGPAYLPALRLSHARYGEVLGKTQALPADDIAPAKMLEGLQELARLINAYTLQVLATADDSKPETVEAARRALQPLLAFRAAASRSRAADKKSPAEPELEPTPV